MVQWLRLRLPIQGTGVQSPDALRPKNQNIKQKQYCNKFNRDFKKKKRKKTPGRKVSQSRGKQRGKDSRVETAVRSVRYDDEEERGGGQDQHCVLHPGAHSRRGPSVHLACRVPTSQHYRYRGRTSPGGGGELRAGCFH